MDENHAPSGEPIRTSGDGRSWRSRLFPLAGLLVVGLLALGLRLYVATELHPPGLHLVSDMLRYDRYARHLEAGTLDRWDAFTPAGYPVFLAVIYRLTPVEPLLLGVGWAQAMMGTLVTLLTVALMLRIRGSVPLALLAGSLVALHPVLVGYTGLALSETLFSLVVMIVSLALPAALMSRRPGPGVIAGLALGVGVASRPALLFLLPLLAVDALRSRQRGLWLAVLGACAVPVLVSGVLTSCALGRPRLLPTNGAINAYFTYADISRIKFPNDGLVKKASTHSSRRHGRGELVTERATDEETHWYHEARGLIAASPSKLVTRPLRNLAESAGIPLPAVGQVAPFWPGFRGMDGPLRWFALGFLVLCEAPAAWATVRGWRRPAGPHRRVLAQLVTSCALASAALLGDPRMHVPFDPLLIVLALDAGASLRDRAGFTRWRRRLAG